VVIIKNVNDLQFPVEMWIGPEKRCLTIKAAAEMSRGLSKAVHKYLENPPESKEPKIILLNLRNRKFRRYAQTTPKGT
jgi:hypothetical protein